MARQQTGGRTRAILFLVGSLIVAGLTAALVVNVLRNSREKLAEAQKPPETTSVVVARRDLYIGLPITEEDVVIRDLLPDMIPGEMVFETVDEVIRRVPRERVLANEPLRQERLAQREAGIGLNAIIATGKRAMTVETNTESGLAGMLQPGNYVDVIVTIRPDDADTKAKWLTKTILQGIRVLAVGDSLTGNKDEDDARKNSRRVRPSVTLELTLEEAEELALASSKGDIHMVLRNDVDITHVDTNDALTTANLIGFDSTDSKAPPPAAPSRDRVGSPTTRPTKPASDPTRVEIIGNSRSETVEYDNDGNKVQNGRNR